MQSLEGDSFKEFLELIVSVELSIAGRPSLMVDVH